MSQHGCPERLSNRSKGFQEDGQSQPTMEVLVETLTGTAFEMTVSPSDTIFAIKSKIFRVEGIPVSQQHLLYNLKELEDSSSLHEHAISDGARLRLVLGMCGGPITTRRLPPPQNEPWRDIERLLDSNRDDGEWGGNGCKVTVLVFREGERVNMLRVRENRDGSYSPLDHNKFEVASGAESLSQLLEAEAEEPPAASRDNAVTMNKMMDLRRRMENLSLQRGRHPPGNKPEIQKTRSEETLSVPSLLDVDVGRFKCKPYAPYAPYSEAEDTFAPLYDGNYTRYDYDCSFQDRYSLLQPISTRTDSEASVAELGVAAGAGAGPGAVGDAPAGDRAPAPAPPPRYGPLVPGGWEACGRGGGVEGAGAGAGGVTLTPRAAHHSAGALHVRAPARRAPAPPLSSSTPDLEQLARHRILPALSRHRNREHLHLSDEGLDGRNLSVGSERRQRRIERICELDPPRAPHHAPAPAPAPTPAPPPPHQEGGGREGRVRCLLCRRRLSVATAHRCRCGGRYCAPHRYKEVHGCAYDYKAGPAPAASATRTRLPDI